MKRVIRYFKELLLTLKSIDRRLGNIEKCVGSDRKGSHIKAAHWNG
ncbi:MAG: hypothetical protein ACTSU6_04810 [Candidatus Njordarchaeales archaeon]